ncbi:hypothetical protein C0583_03625 [Candidatus Parcubacteria bacterium]|nr:MAG: hypothetical protein C0583_03625 [Candidatus Parcubacteria bacterium]
MNDYDQTESKINWRQAIVLLAITSFFAIAASFMIMNARKETRDVKRIADIRAIQHALELYFYDCNHYPSSVEAGGSISSVNQCQGNVYMESVPIDPNFIVYSYLPCKDEAGTDCEAGLSQPL